MRKMVLLGVCFLSAAMASAQPAKSAFDAFRDSVMKQQFVLRNFSGETKVHAEWNGTQFALDTPRWHTFGVIQVHSVKQNGEEVRMECERHALLRDSLDKLVPYAVVDTVEITIDLQGGSPAQVLPELRDAIFYSSTSDALAAVPEPLQRFVPAHVDKTEKNPAAVGMPSCDCNQGKTCATSPIVVYTASPEYSEEGSKRKINGEVDSAFIVDETGHTHDLWITRPLGYGMDEKAAETVSGYVFKPATCHGKPVSAPMTAGINFQIF